MTIKPHYSHRLSTCSALGGALLALVLGAACGDNGSQVTPTPDANEPDPPVPPSEYAFESRFEPGASSVSYSGQVFRQVLTADLGVRIRGLTARIDDPVNPFEPSAEDVLAELLFYYDFDGTTGGTVEIEFDTAGDVPLLQQVYGDISGGAELRGKVAGNDASTDHEDWQTAFAGWTEDPVTSPDSLVTHWFGEIAALAADRALDTIPNDPDGNPIAVAHVTATGQDLAALVESFLLVAINYSQGTDDYLDDDVEGKGLLAPNERNGEDPFAVLEHQWDEGYGYFGAARDLNDYELEEIAGLSGRADFANGYHDTDRDGAIDLKSEFQLPFPRLAAERDATAEVPTEFVRTAFENLIAGRHILSVIDGVPDAATLAELRVHRDAIVNNWEKALAATIIHHANATLAHMDAFGTPNYDFYAHADDWARLKGLALGLQFNPHALIDDETAAGLHETLGDKPALPSDDPGVIDAYRTGLTDVISTLGDVYGFDPANVQGW